MNETPSAPRLCIVLVNWNGAEYTIPCIESLMKSHDPNFQLVVVDDGSTDASPDLILGRFPSLDLLRQPANLGVWKARNRGIEFALQRGCDCVLILDNDTRVDPALISNLVEAAVAADHRAVVGPKIYWLQHPDRLWFAFGRLNLWTGLYSNPVYNQVDHGQFEEPVFAEVASSCCMLIPKRVFETVGGFDETFGVWARGDVEWSLRCRRAGFRLLYCPRAKLWHRVGGSMDKMAPSLVRYLSTRNQLWTLRKVTSRWQMASIAAIYPFRAVLRIVAKIARGQWDCVPAELRGAKDGFFAPLN